MWFVRQDDPIRAPDEGAGSVLDGFEMGDQVGNPLYMVIDEHALAAVTLVVLPLLLWAVVRFVRRSAQRGRVWAMPGIDDYDSLTLPRRVAVWMVASSATIHLILAVTHEPSWYNAAYLGGAFLLGFAARWLVSGRRTGWAVMVIVGSIVGFWFLGAPADQLSMATKLLELFALALLATPAAGRRLAPTGVVTLVVLTGVAAWIGAFATAGADGGHHGGEFPEPGTVVPYIDRLEATEAEQAAADAVYASLLASVERYRDPAVARAAGYQVGEIVGTDYHAQNPGLVGDGRILDPEYPESLIYARATDGPVLVGVMFEMDGLSDPGPRIGGPITVWHSHENVCFSLTPVALAGLLSPYGVCPLGSVNIPITGEMLHVWVAPGVPYEDRWGHVDEEWMNEFLGLSS
jgi:hypothetical protein